MNVALLGYSIVSLPASFNFMINSLTWVTFSLGGMQYVVHGGVVSVVGGIQVSAPAIPLVAVVPLIVDATGAVAAYMVMSAEQPLPDGGGFADYATLADHITRHGGDFGATTAAQYERQASGFLNGPRRTGVLEKVRPNGDVVRYNPATQEFGGIKPDGTIRTYYKPDPAVHGHPSNLDYFNAQ